MITFSDLAVSMLKCEQTKGQTLYQHGLSVKNHLENLLYYLENDISRYQYKIPDIIKKYKFELLENIHDEQTLSLYTIYHDCGKSFCKIIDVDGKVHFPNHALISKQKYLESGGDIQVANLIGWDMILHEGNYDTINDFLKIWSIKDSCTLLLTAFAEINSNSKMFGGIDSISYKSKYKKLERRSKQICNFYFEKDKQ